MAKRERQIGITVKKIQDGKERPKDRRVDKSCVLPLRGWREREEVGGGQISPFLGPLQEGMAPICPTLTFERISDCTGERGQAEVSGERESSTRGLWHEVLQL